MDERAPGEVALLPTLLRPGDWSLCQTSCSLVRGSRSIARSRSRRSKRSLPSRSGPKFLGRSNSRSLQPSRDRLLLGNKSLSLSPMKELLPRLLSHPPRPRPLSPPPLMLLPKYPGPESWGLLKVEPMFSLESRRGRMGEAERSRPTYVGLSRLKAGGLSSRRDHSGLSSSRRNAPGKVLGSRSRSRSRSHESPPREANGIPRPRGAELKVPRNYLARGPLGGSRSADCWRSFDGLYEDEVFNGV